VALGDQFGAEHAAEQSEAHAALEREVEFLDRLEEREVRTPDAPLDPGLGAVRDLLGHQDGEELAVAEAIRLGPLDQFGIEPTYRRQVQASEERIEINRRRHGAHRAPSKTLGRGIPR
jgi:hypothetical protein